MPRRVDLAIIFFIALAANVAYQIASNGDLTFPDSQTYIAPARYLMHGDGFVSEPEVPETIRTPAYPLLLIPFLAMTSSLAPIVAVQHLLNALLALAIYLFVMRRMHSRFAAFAAALCFALDTPTIHYANKVLTETLFTVALFALFALALRGERLLICGALCSVLVLIRPVAIAWFVVLAIFFAWRRIAWRRVAAFVAMALVLPLLWGVRNYTQTGVFTVSSIGATNLLMYRAAGALAIDEEEDFAPSLAKAQRDLLDEAEDLITQEEHVATRGDLPHAVQAKYFTRIARETIAENRIAFVQLTIRGLLMNLFDSDWESMMMVSALHGDIVKLLITFTNAAFVILGAIGVVVLWRRDRDLALLIAVTVGYFLFITAGGESEARFRVPVVPQLAIAAACALDVIRRAASPSPR